LQPSHRLPLRQESSGEENEHDVLKPFIAIQRV
jgi:hypothetical protein